MPAVGGTKPGVVKLAPMGGTKPPLGAVAVFPTEGRGKEGLGGMPDLGIAPCGGIIWGSPLGGPPLGIAIGFWSGFCIIGMEGLLIGVFEGASTPGGAVTPLGGFPLCELCDWRLSSSSSPMTLSTAALRSPPSDHPEDVVDALPLVPEERPTAMLVMGLPEEASLMRWCHSSSFAKKVGLYTLAAAFAFVPTMSLMESMYSSASLCSPKSASAIAYANL